MRNTLSLLTGAPNRIFTSRGKFLTPASLFTQGEDGVWYDTSDISTLFQDNAGTTPITASGQTIGFVRDKSGNGLNATQATTAARPSYIVDADGAFIQHDPVDDALTVTLPDMGTAATVAYVTRSEVRLLEDQTLNGSYTLPTQEIANFVAIDRALTFAEKVSLIRFLAAKVEGVNYGAEIDRLTLIAINAVDVFVYDTSKDSDGGAWRKRTQGTSWYNETLSTATRGSRREFPAVAVIVVEDIFVKIYDGDDPSLPLWARVSNAIPSYSATENSSVFAINGVVCIGGNAGYGGLAIIDFPAAKNTWHGFGQGGFPNGVYVQENWTTTTDRPKPESATYVSGQVLVNNSVNDVAMTVLPDAPIDAATGLPVPTIAVATEGGVSVIKDDGTVVDITGTPVPVVKFTQDGKLVTGRSSVLNVGPIPTQDGTENDWRTSFIWDFSQNVRSLSGAISSIADLGDGVLVDGRLEGLTISTPTDPVDGMVAYTTSTYNTGWMNGDIKGAFLSDTDDTDLVATDTIADRSVNGLTLTLGDSCTVAPVASGAELVGYTFASAETVTLGSDISSTGALIWWEKVAGNWQLNVNDLSGGVDYVNGSSGTVSTGLTISGTTLTFAASKEMSLARATATIPTAEQIAKIYNDEKVLFQENAQATLYGSSDAVTALAHDPVTDLLHVGTSAGRSVFQGLRRVENTTTAVATAISASNGLVVEE